VSHALGLKFNIYIGNSNNRGVDTNKQIFCESSQSSSFWLLP
jgi:hypothetical protein